MSSNPTPRVLLELHPSNRQVAAYFIEILAGMATAALIFPLALYLSTCVLKLGWANAASNHWCSFHDSLPCNWNLMKAALLGNFDSPRFGAMNAIYPTLACICFWPFRQLVRLVARGYQRPTPLSGLELSASGITVGLMCALAAITWGGPSSPGDLESGALRDGQLCASPSSMVPSRKIAEVIRTRNPAPGPTRRL